MFIFHLFLNSIIPLMMIIFGFIWKKNPPVGVNWVYGYRTKMSMKNEETWKFAHMHNAEIWSKVGTIWLVISIIPMFLFKQHMDIISEWVTIIGLVIMVVSLIPTEIALRRKFDKEGNLK